MWLWASENQRARRVKLTDAQTVDIGLTPEPGIYLNVPAADYFCWPYLSKSALTKFCISPAQHRGIVDGILQWGRTDSMLLGSAVDVLWFDGEKIFREVFALEPSNPPLRKNGKPYKDWINSSPGKRWAEHQQSIGKTVLTKTIWTKAAAMVVRLNEHQAEPGHVSASELREQGTAQVSLVWICPRTKIWMKGRPDLVDFERLILSDLKTAQDVRRHGFANAISTYDYHWQMYLYRQALEILTGRTGWVGKYIAVRNEPIHSVEIYNLVEPAFRQAESEVRQKLWEYLACADNNHWPADSGLEKDIDLAGWRRHKGEAA